MSQSGAGGTAADGHLEAVVVGLGTIAATHLKVLAKQPSVVVSAVVDPDEQRQIPVPGLSPARYDSLEDALEHHQPGLIVIASPTQTHADLAVVALTHSTARILVEKPLAQDPAALATFRALPPAIGVEARLFVAHHFAFAPEVEWAAAQLAENPEWGPPTRITVVFHDPYVTFEERAIASYTSSWTDSGVNQLSMLTRLVDLVAVDSPQTDAAGTVSWSVLRFQAGSTSGTARLATSWRAADSSKRTVVELGRSDVQLWLDHTAMTGLAIRGNDLLARLDDDGRVPRKVAHYQPLYQSLLSATPDRVIGFETGARIVELLGGTSG